MSIAGESAISRGRPTFLGEPPALGFLAFTEAWERFSYYGMTALLVVYMSYTLFLPGHVEHVAGFQTFRAVLESVFGKMGTVALASQVYGLYTGFVYFTPIFGGIIADRFIGRRNAVLIGAALMSAGHIAMAFDASFLLALALLITGCGLLKGNISTQVGELYDLKDSAGRTRGFAIFSAAINVGAVAGPLGCGLLEELYGPHAGFGLAGVLMLFGLATYAYGYRFLPDNLTAKTAKKIHAPLTRHDRIVIAALVATMLLTVFQSIAFYQNSNIGLIWIRKYADLNFLGTQIPVPWFTAINSFVSIIAVPPLFALWRWQATRRGEPDELQKIGIGSWLTALANIVLVAACFVSGRPSSLFPLLYNSVLGVSFLYYWPTLLALVSRTAPQSVRATLMGCAFLSLFVSNITLGWLGGFYEQTAPWQFWAINAAIAASGGVLVWLVRPFLEKILATPPGESG